MPKGHYKRKPTQGFKKGHKINVGKKYTLGYKHTEESKKKISKASKNISIETRKKLSEARKGEKHWNWQGGIAHPHKVIRNSLEYKLWRKAVFERDKYTCIWCGCKSGDGKAVILNADHIKPFAYYPELRFAIDNGRTLCTDCHKTTDTFAGKIKNK